MEVVSQAQSGLVPQVSVDANNSASSRLPEFGRVNDFYTSALNLNFDPDVFGQRRSEVARAFAVSQAAKAAELRTRREIDFAVTVTYLAIIEAKLQVELADETVQFLEETFRIVSARHAAGELTLADVKLAELSLLNSKASLNSTKLIERDLTRSLSLLTGGYGSTKRELPSNFPPIPNLQFETVPANVVSARYDISLAKANLAANIAAWDSTAKDDWPTITLGGRISTAAGDFAELLDLDSYILSLSSSLIAVIFDGGRNDAQQAAAKFAVLESVSVYEQAVRNSISEVRIAMDRVDTLSSNLDLLSSASSAARRSLELEKIKYDQGEVPLLDVLSIQQRVNSTRSAEIRIRREYLASFAELYFAAGTDLLADEKEVIPFSENSGSS